MVQKLFSLHRCLHRKLKDLASRGTILGQAPDLKECSRETELAQILVADPRAIVRRVLVECLADWNGPGRTKLLFELLSDKSGEVRCEVLVALGNLLEGGRCPPRVFICLRDKSDIVRVTTAEVLGQIGDRRALRHLWSALQDRSALVRSYVAPAIGELGGKSVVARLKRALATERSSTAKVGFFTALYSLGDTSFAVDGLRGLLQSRKYQVRCATANTLASLRVSRAQHIDIAASLRAALKAEPTVAARQALRRAIEELRQEPLVRRK